MMKCPFEMIPKANSGDKHLRLEVSQPNLEPELSRELGGLNPFCTLTNSQARRMSDRNIEKCVTVMFSQVMPLLWTV